MLPDRKLNTIMIPNYETIFYDVYNEIQLKPLMKKCISKTEEMCIFKKFHIV